MTNENEIELVSKELNLDKNSLFDFINNVIAVLNLPGLNLLKSLGALSTMQSRKNLFQFLTYLEIQVNGNRELLNKNIKSVAEINNRLNEEMVATLITRTVKKVLEGQREEKIKIFATVLSNCIFKGNDLSIIDKENCIDFCDDLNEVDLEILQILNDILRGNCIVIGEKYYQNHDITEINVNKIIVSLSKLDSRGLIMLSESKMSIFDERNSNNEDIDKFKTLSDVAYEKEYEILPYGQKLIGLITSSISN